MTRPHFEPLRGKTYLDTPEEQIHVSELPGFQESRCWVKIVASQANFVLIS